MNSFPRMLLLLVMGWVVTLATNTIHADDKAMLSDSLTTKVYAVLPEHIGAAVLAIDNGEVIFRQAYSIADVETQAPVTTQTNFRIASITKQFTATAVMLLVDEGRLSLDDTLDSFFPGFPDYGKRITVRQVLNHRSGLPDYEDLIPEDTTLQVHDLDVLKIILETDAPIFEPGTDYKYSNTGYALLGLIVEQTASQPFHDFLRERLFQPLKMNDTVMYVRGLNEVSARAFGHSKKDGQWIRDDQSVTSAVRGDGGIYCSIDDLTKWLNALDQHKLLSEASYKEMFTPVPTDDDTIAYGFGWRIDTYKDQHRVHHTGGTRGFSLCLQRFPDRDAAVVVLFNNNVEGGMTPVTERVADVLLFDGE